MDTTGILDGWAASMRAANFTPATVKLRTSHISTLLRSINKPLLSISTSDLEAWLGNRGIAGATKRSYRASFQSLWRYLEREGYGEDVAQALAPARVPRTMPRPAPDPVISAAIKAAPDRVRLMIELMALGGLRRCEVCTVQASDMTTEGLRVIGKGGHIRYVPLPGWLAMKVRSCSGWLFPGAIRGHLSPKRVGELVSEALPEGITAHMLRHRYATAVYRASRDIRAVQELLGHAKIDTTMIYIGLDAETTRGAARGGWDIAA